MLWYIEKIEAARMVLAVPNTINPNSKTNSPESDLMVTDAETTVDAPINFSLSQ